MKPFEAQHGAGYITADIESPLAKVKMDIHEMPFEDNRFDVVLCNHVLEHVRDDMQALHEIKRCIETGRVGDFVGSVYQSHTRQNILRWFHYRPAWAWKIFGQNDHVRKYGKIMPNALALSGMTVDEDKFAFSIDAATKFRLGLSPEIIYKVMK